MNEEMMLGTLNAMMRKFKARTCAVFLVLAIGLSAFAGCATEVKSKPVVVEQPVMVNGPSVTKLDDYREGFIITEPAKLDESSRKDFKRAVDALHDQDFNKAIEFLEKVIDNSPGVTAPYIDIAIAYEHIGKPEQAEENLKTALKLFPGHPVASNEYALLERKAGKFAEARELYEKAIVRFPDYYPAHRNLGILCDLYLNDVKCALEHYQIYSDAMPDDEKVKIWIADLRNRLGQE